MLKIDLYLHVQKNMKLYVESIFLMNLLVQLEQQLRQRCSEAGAEARVAVQRETIATERLGHQQEGVSAAEARVMSLQVAIYVCIYTHKNIYKYSFTNIYECYIAYTYIRMSCRCSIVAIYVCIYSDLQRHDIRKYV